MALESQKAARLEDPGAETLERITSVWDRYGRIVLGVLVAAVAIAGVTFMLLRNRAAQEEQAASALAEANVLFWQGDYARSLERANQVAQQYGSTPSGIEAYRLAGDDAFWSGDFKSAVGHYRRYLDKNKTGLLSDAGRRSLAYALESSGEYVEAAKTYESLIGRFDRVSSAEFLAAAARSYRLANQPAESLKRLQRLESEFGETSYARDARIQIAELTAAGAR